MRSIPPGSPLSVGDVLHHAAFGFATVVAVDPTGASLHWEGSGSLRPSWVSRAALGDAYHQCESGGLLALTVRDLEHARRLLRADVACAVGRLLLDVGPAAVDELGEWLATRHLVPREEFPAFWAAQAERLSRDDRFSREGGRWTTAARGTDPSGFPDPSAPKSQPLPPPGSCRASDALDLACGLARALCVLHQEGKTLVASGETPGVPPGEAGAFTRVGAALVAKGQPGGERCADVSAVARILLEQVLGPLPDRSQIPVSEILNCLGELAPELPFELGGPLERALCSETAIRHPDGFSLLHDFETARATHRLREGFPMQPDARIVAGFDSHIGIARALTGQVNQDALLVLGDPECALLVVADGISTATAGSGDLASRLLAQTLTRWWAESAPAVRSASTARVHETIREGLGRANRLILQEAAKAVNGPLAEHVPMGTTLILIITQGNRVHLASLGDSRAWVVGAGGAGGAGGANVLTSDQNLQSQLLREHVSGTDPDWTEERFALTGYCGHLDAFGRPALPPVHTRTFTLLPGEWVVMTTDGFSDYAHPENAGLALLLTSTICAAHGATPAQRAMAIARRLVEASNEGGGGDNVTVLAFTLSTGTTLRPVPRRGGHADTTRDPR
ncbi:MAG: serine/threonine-protein phosphatase [Myxococcales bacterium]|nr:serine/threonine-protein phosphatase [Myxococcales bacterium]